MEFNLIQYKCSICFQTTNYILIGREVEHKSFYFMQIFFLSFEPEEAAQQLCDKHVIKQILEAAQMLCTVHFKEGSTAPYKPCFPKHPCVLWMQESIKNYRWTVHFGLECCKEYQYRYGEHRIHKSQAVLEWLLKNEPTLPNVEFTKPRLAMPEQYKNDCVVKSYRDYILGEKRNFCVWTKRSPPEWFIEGVRKYGVKDVSKYYRTACKLVKKTAKK